jgi:hypothetical protein
MHRFFFFFSSSFLSSFSLVPITRATASVYSHEADGGGTLSSSYSTHPMCMHVSVCLMYKKKKINGSNEKKNKKRRNIFNRVIMRRRRRKKRPREKEIVFCSVCVSYELIQNRFN